MSPGSSQHCTLLAGLIVTNRTRKGHGAATAWDAALETVVLLANQWNPCAMTCSVDVPEEVGAASSRSPGCHWHCSTHWKALPLGGCSVSVGGSTTAGASTFSLPRQSLSTWHVTQGGPPGRISGPVPGTFAACLALPAHALLHAQLRQPLQRRQPVTKHITQQRSTTTLRPSQPYKVGLHVFNRLYSAHTMCVPWSSGRGFLATPLLMNMQVVSTPTRTGAPCLMPHACQPNLRALK